VNQAALAFLLLAAACPAAAQSPAAQPPAPPAPAAPQPQPAERRPLILELDETSRRQIMSGSRSTETGARGANLPSLGEDARKVDPALMRGSPFPKNYNDIEAPN
jgi:hypothetical protein